MAETLPIWPLLIPLAACLILYVYVRWQSRRFDRTHPHLTREGMREAERRENRDGDGI